MFYLYFLVFPDEVDNWFLMTSWVPITSIVAGYLVFVLYAGPKWMANRKPFDIKYILLVYNLAQTLINLYYSISTVSTPGSLSYIYNHTCHPIRPRSLRPLQWKEFMRASYGYFLVKVLDLLDTVFFVLKKKWSHITFLHVYHHLAMVITTWAYLKFIKGEQTLFLGAINCFVHVAMYSYYFLSAFGPRVQKYLWWKNYITMLQIIQFILVLLQHVGLIVLDCKVDLKISYFIVGNAILFILLFGNFYYKTYIKKRK